MRKLDNPLHICKLGCTHPMSELGMLYNHAEPWESELQSVIISHPFYLTNILGAAAHAQEAGWTMEVYDKLNSWYAPGETWLVITLGRAA